MRRLSILLLLLYLSQHFFVTSEETKRPWRRFLYHLLRDEEADEPPPDLQVFKNPRNAPSETCPRDEVQAQNQGRKCLRKCTSDEDCKSKKKKCLCDGACGLSCIKPDKECEELGDPDLGHVEVQGRQFGDKAVYSCRDDYRVVGLEERVCQADGTWSGQAPTCKKNIYCTEPPVIEHARHNAPLEQTTFDMSTMLQYQCYPGYTTKGFARAKCLFYNGTARWFGPDVSCEPRNCGEPADILNGRREGTCFSFSCRVTYHCQPGFELEGRTHRYCQADGTWSPRELPSCGPVQCPIPDNPVNGKALFTAVSYNSVVSYECKYGFMLVGESTRRCGTDKRWSGEEPACKEINCGSPGLLYNGWLEGTKTTLHAVVTFRCLETMAFRGPSQRTVCQSDGTWSHPLPQCLEINCGHPGILFNGWLENIESGTALGSSIIYRCYDGMKLVGHTSSVCQIDGKWRYPLPKCLAPCIVPTIQHGRVEGQLPGSQVQHEEHILVECDPQHELAYNASPATCHNGTWTHIPRCEPARCKQLPLAPKHGMVIAPKNDHGMKAKFKCKDGFVLYGNNVTECRYGKWIGQTPVCKEVYCPYPGTIDNGKVLLVGSMGLYDYRPYVRRIATNRQIMYECDRGYVLTQGPPGATCLGGRWTPFELPRCIPAMHPRIGQRFARSAEDIHNGKTKRLTRKGNMATKRGRKKDKKKACEAIPKEPYIYVDIVKAGRDPNQTYAAGVIVRVTCSQGYGLNMPLNSTSKCVRGKWRPKKPQCITLPCLVPGVDHSWFKRADGVPLSAGHEVAHGEAAEFGCESGYQASNTQGTTATLRCWYGDWAVSQMPECLSVPCELPPLNRGQYMSGYRPGLTIAHGSSVDYTCEEGTGKATAQPLRCRLGQLRPRPPACVEGGAEFKGGSDITRGGDISVIDFPAGTGSGYRRACGPPARVQGSLVFKDGEPLEETDGRFPDGTHVTFNCVASIMGEKTTWRIVCEDGSWVGRSLNCEMDNMADLDGTGNQSCVFRNAEPNVVAFYNDQQITEDVVEFPAGTELIFRCVDIGKYALNGSRRRRCHRGEWDGVKPVCFGLNQENDYALEKPPTILFRHQLGPIAQSNDGKLIVYPGTILHMECLWIRRFGAPRWEVSHSYRKYPETWSTDPGRDPNLEYRLSIYHAQRDDSGTFTCVTPTRHTHSIEIEVKAIHCPPIPDRRGLHVSTQSTKMNARVLFSCNNGNNLLGAHEATCLPSGNWSSPAPVCESIECPDMSNLTDRNVKVSILSREVGGRAVFSCSLSYGLRGPSEAICQQSGEWSDPLPKCEEVRCEPPTPPEHGYLLGFGIYKAGDIVQFHCHTGYMLEGRPIIVCQENGRWSRPAPKCVQACTYPGTTIGGSISLVKFYYSIGENVTFECAEGFEIHGARMLRCLRNGKWSNAIPNCLTPST